MRPLTAAMLLDVWERSRELDPVRRALTLLAASCPETTQSDLAKLPLGERDSRLLTLRSWCFGRRMSGIAVCPECGERVETTFEVEQIRSEVSASAELCLHAEGQDWKARVPDSTDLMFARSRRELLERCLLGRPEGHAVVSDAVLDALEARLPEADPQANVELALECPACETRWLALFDIVSFLWREVEVWAVRMLRDVHTLASAYGWSENEVLALSPWRRQFYLGMVAP